MIVFALLAAGTMATAAEPDHVTDRPDQTESSQVVPPGRAQIEAGFVHGGSDNGKRWEALGTLLRIGLGHGWEARLGHAGYFVEDPDDGGKTEGWGDGELGAKVRLRDEAGWLPEIALLASVSLPTGEDGFSSDGVDSAFRFLLSHTLTERLSLGCNIGGEWNSNLDEVGARERIAALIYTLSLGMSLTEVVGAFIEIYGDIPEESHAAHRLDGGFTFAVTDSFQLDVSAGVGMGEVSDEWFVAAGFSKRWPN